jgi:hypothetical protein
VTLSLSPAPCRAGIFFAAELRLENVLGGRSGGVRQADTLRKARPLRTPPLLVRIEVGATDAADRISEKTGFSYPVNFPFGALP